MIELACRSKECAPPPVGRGGSLPGTGRDPVWGTPPEPGTAELEPGEFLAYHYTSSDEALSSILREGVKLDTSERRPTEEAAAVWGSFERPQPGKRYVEFKVRYEDLYIGQPNGPEGMEGAAARGSNFTMAKGEIPVDRITTWSDQGIEDVRVWQRELADATPEWKKSVLNGAYDGVPAVDKAKQVLAKEFGSPGWAEKPSGVPDDVAVKSASVPRVDTDRLQRRADRLRREIDDPNFVYPGARMGFRHRAAELTAVESELVRRGALGAAERRTSVVAGLIELACRDASCAPPPVGTGGSKPAAGLAGGSRARQVVIDTISEIGEGSEESLKFGRQMLLSRQKVRGFHQLSGQNADLDPAMLAEHAALSKAVPVQPGFVRDGTEAAAKLTSRIREVLPSAQVGWMDDVHAESVEAVLDGVALYPEEVRDYVQGVALGYTEAESHVAAFGPHGGGLMGPAAPGATLWLGPKAVRPAIGEANLDGASVMTTVDGFNRHRLVGAHEMGHVVHNMAAERAWKEDGIRVDLRADGYLPQDVPTTRYGGLDTGEMVAETFALAARDSFKSLEPLQQDVVVSVLDRAGLRPSDLAFAAATDEPYEVQFFGDDFGLDEAAAELQASGCQSEDCAPPPVGTGGSKKSGMRGQARPVSKIIPLKAEGGYDGEIDPSMAAYGEMAKDPHVAGLMAHTRRLTALVHQKDLVGDGNYQERFERAVALVESGVHEVNGVRVGWGPKADAFIGDYWFGQSMRGVVSATLKSETPDPKVVELIQRMHRTTVDFLGGDDVAITLARSHERGKGPFGGNNAAKFGSYRYGDEAGTSVTSWADSERNGRSWGEMYVERTFGMDQILMREGSVPGEYLVAENPKVIERLMEGVGSAPFVRPGEAIYDPISQTYARSGKPQKFVVASAGCQSEECAPPPVGSGGSKPGGGRVAEIDGEALDLASMVEDAYGQIWDDIPDVIERAYQLKMAMDHRMDAGVGQEEAYQSSLEEIDASDGDMPSMYSAFIDDSNWWTELRSVVSATSKSPSPDADMQVLIQRMHETTQETFSRERVSSIQVARSFDTTYSIDGNEGAAALYGKRSGDDAAPRSGITSWSASTYSAQGWGTETDEQTLPVEQVLMREGSIDGEFLVGESVERVQEIVGR